MWHPLSSFMCLTKERVDFSWSPLLYSCQGRLTLSESFLLKITERKVTLPKSFFDFVIYHWDLLLQFLASWTSVWGSLLLWLLTEVFSRNFSRLGHLCGVLCFCGLSLRFSLAISCVLDICVGFFASVAYHWGFLSQFLASWTTVWGSLLLWLITEVFSCNFLRLCQCHTICRQKNKSLLTRCFFLRMYPGSKCKVSLDIQDLLVKLFLYLQDLVFILTPPLNFRQ